MHSAHVESVYPLSPLYINQRRVAELVGSEVFSNAIARVAGLNDKQESFIRSVKAAELLRTWMEVNAGELHSLESLLISGELEIGKIFIYEGYLYCKNATGTQRNKPSEAHVPLPEFGPDEESLRFQLQLHPDHVVAGSPGDLLAGKVGNLVVIAQCLAIDTAKIRAVPLFIGSFRKQGPLEMPLQVGRNEVFIDDIDNFSKAKNTRTPSIKDISVLRDIPEADVKSAFAEIIGESDIPKDWGGERSDLVTTQLRINGRRLSTAIAFKGPAGGNKFREMKMSDLGKNGDQIARLATEPAELLVVQHCHKISNAVKITLRAFCNQVGSERSFCLIPGQDTYRILKAYGKCGL